MWEIMVLSAATKELGIQLPKTFPGLLPEWEEVCVKEVP